MRRCLLLQAAALILAACAPDPAVPPLPPPAPGAGFQIRTEPTHVPPGTENTDCYFFRVPEDHDVFVGRIVMRQTPGTHHMNIFRVRTLLDLRGEHGTVVRGGNDTSSPCWKSHNWADWPLLVNSQTSEPGTDLVFALPEGVAHRLAAGELLMLQSHYVNATTQQTPGAAEVWVNFEYLDAADVRAELGTLFTTNPDIEVCPGQTRAFEKVCQVPGPITVVGANGHFHSRGTRFSMFAWDPARGRGARFYDSPSWEDPLMATGLDVHVPAGGGILYRCEFQAPAGTCGDADRGCCFRFGPRVETSEHCNAFVYYYPRLDAGIPCF
jgi:hypothetical protein